MTADSIYYIERRPAENGRCMIVKTGIPVANEKPDRVDVLTESYSARSRVHEYGGGCYCLNEMNNELYFVNDNDQNIYCVTNDGTRQITFTDNSRFADIQYENHQHRLIAICETREEIKVSNSVVAIDIDSGKITTLVKDHDFFASPRLNHNGTLLCWQSWDHPNMPWDGNQLWIASVDKAGLLSNKVCIAGAENISTCQPQWSADGKLYFISDDTGWWHLYRYDPLHFSSDLATSIERLTNGEKEFGLPQWVFGQSSYAFLNQQTIICSYRTAGKMHLARLALGDTAVVDDFSTIETPWQEFSSISTTNDLNTNNHCSFIAASDNRFPELVVANIEIDNGKLVSQQLQTSCVLPMSKENFSQAKTIEFENRHNQKVYANYYPPTNPEYNADKNLKPPLIVICHGGPTGQSSIALDPKKQFWTSRGFALLDVDYSGSTGYGRDYRLRLNGKWGQLDVEDCCDAALYAVANNLTDEKHLIIRGSSAGGLTVLSALTFHSVFSAGASYYGISELSSLATDTHKFEARYLDNLIASYPEHRELYQQRSPINHTEQLNCPVIFFQGIDDKVVPKEQSEKMFTALDKKGVTVAAQYFIGEQHGFRKADTIQQSLQNELLFYQLVLGLKAKHEIRFIGDIKIKNVD